MSQTSYSQNMAAGFEGMIADSSEVQDIESCRNPDGAVLIGKFVTKGVADDEVKAPGAATDITSELVAKGVVVQANEFESSQFNGMPPAYAPLSIVPVMRKGRIWVRPEDVITVGTSTVNVRYSGGTAGNFLGAASAGASAVMPKSKWKTSTSGTGQLAILEIDL